MIVVKKYGNRRLYDMSESRYVTLEELAAKVRSTGDEVQVVDAKTGKDLTQATLAQIIIESRGAARLLPVPLLVQMIRMGDDSLAEFFNRYVTAALSFYLQAKQGAQTFSSYLPFGGSPLGGGDPLARWLANVTPWPGAAGAPAEPAARPEPPKSPAAPVDAISELRRELQDLKKSLKRSGRKRR